MTTVHIPPGEGPNYQMIDGAHVVKASVRDVEGAFEVFEVIAPAAPMGPPHVFPWTAVLDLVEGRLRASVGNTTYDVRPGGVVVFPAGTPSTFEVVGDSPESWRSPPVIVPDSSSPTLPAPCRSTSSSRTRWGDLVGDPAPRCFARGDVSPDLAQGARPKERS